MPSSRAMKRATTRPQRALIVWGNWGPYHHARFAAARNHLATAGWELEGVQMYSRSGIYSWEPSTEEGVHDIGLEPPEMQFRPFRTVRAMVPLLIRRRPTVVFLPSYWHWSLMLNVIARCVGARTIMMNDTHAATSQTGRSRMAFKALVVRQFGAALVAGTLAMAFFEGMGLDERRIFAGYDVVDNAHFASGADLARANGDGTRRKHDLPQRYILSLGRLVAKKNLSLLVSAYADVRTRLGDATPDLVIVGEGDERAALVRQCIALGLPTVDHHPGGEVAACPAAASVHFHPYADYAETPEFMGLADMLVLPSTIEEWGLVVNEAMASGTCVVVSDAVGSVPDLCIDNVTAAVFGNDDVQELSLVLERLCTDDELRRQLATGGRKLINSWGLERFAAECLHAIEAATST